MTDNDSSAKLWDFDRVFRLLMLVGGIVGLICLVRFLADVLIPFAIALLLAYLLNPVVHRLEARLGGRRGAAVMLTVTGALLVTFVLVIVLVPMVAGELSDFGSQIKQLGFVQNLARGAPLSSQVQEGQQSLANAYQDFRANQPEWLGETLDTAVAGLSAELSGERMSAHLADLAGRIAPGLLGLVSGALSFLLGLTVIIVIMLYLVFILMDYDRVTTGWPGLLPPTYKATILRFVDEFSLAMKRYFRGQFVVACTVGVLFAVGFKLIDLRMGILLGLFVGLLNMVPYLQIAGMVPALLLGLFRALEHGSSVVGSLLLVLLVFAVVQTIQDALITPRVMGKATGLRPLAILLGVFIWGKLFGFLGLVLAIPLTCLGIAYYSRFVLGKLDAKVIADEA